MAVFTVNGQQVADTQDRKLLRFLRDERKLLSFQQCRVVQ